MIKTKIPNISAQDVIQTIKKELSSRKDLKEEACTKNISFTISQKKQQSKIYQFAKKIGKFLQKKGLYSFVAFIQRTLKLHQNNYIYEINDFVKFFDEKFIDNAYKLILQRSADEDGKNYYLQLLRSGKLSKVEIITSLYFSNEGRKQNVIILGIKKRYIQSLVYKIPIIGYVAKIIFTVLTIPKLISRINSQENSFYMHLETKSSNEIVSNLQKHLESQQRYLELQQKHLESQIETKSSNETVSNLQKYLESGQKHLETQLEAYLQTLNYAKEYMRQTERNMQNLIDEAKKRLPDEGLNQKQLLTVIEEEKHKFDTFYVEFEDKFRGSREDIKSRVKVYLPYIQKLPFEPESVKALDVGCGRGEWLEILKENGYKNAKGIDLNRIMVAKSQELSLDVKQADVIEYLSSLEDESLSLITGFHIVEHLPFEVLMRLFQESYRVLQKDGIVIFETPNPENILVGAHYFYTDPTHINPLVPTTLYFIAQQNGFNDIEIKRLHKYSQYNDIDVTGKFISDNFLNEMDYAVIGYKR